MKRIVAVLIIALMLVGCGGSKSAESEQDASVPETFEHIDIATENYDVASYEGVLLPVATAWTIEEEEDQLTITTGSPADFFIIKNLGKDIDGLSMSDDEQIDILKKLVPEGTQGEATTSGGGKPIVVYSLENESVALFFSKNGTFIFLWSCSDGVANGEYQSDFAAMLTLLADE